MRRLGLAFVFASLLVVTALVPAAQHARAETGIEIGNYWEYQFVGDLLGFSGTGTLKMKVAGTTGSGTSEAFLIENGGTGVFSGTFENTSVSGSMQISGEARRLVSNYSLLAMVLAVEMTMEMMSIPVDISVSTEQTADPPLDDYIGDNNPGLGVSVVSKSSITVDTTTEMMGIPSTESDAYDATATMVVGATNQTVVVPAGTFDCYVVTFTLANETDEEVSTYYYSDIVGNYVKMSDLVGSMMGIGDFELKSYSYGKKESWLTTTFSGTNLLILIGVIVGVVVVSLVFVLRKRGKGAEPALEPPPPPPSG